VVAPAPGDEIDTWEVLAARLTAEGKRSQALIRDLKEELVAIAESTAAVPDDEHDAEGSTVAYERARVQALLARAEHTAAEIQAATQRVCAAGAAGGAGDAGGAPALRCQRCQAPIPFERLIALPATRTCVACAGREGPSGPSAGADGRAFTVGTR
jgi:DnaK suppressor protein